MLHQENTIGRPGTTSQIQNRKMLLLNGHPAIEYHSHDNFYQNTLFSENNILLVSINGELNLNYGNTEYFVGKSQMAFLKSNTMIEYETTKYNGRQDKVEFVFFSLNYSLVKEFVSLTRLSSTMQNNNAEITINLLDSNLLKYMDSLTLYLDDPSTANKTVIRMKLLELLFCLTDSAPEIIELLLDLKKKYIPDITTVVEDNLMNPLSINQLAALCGRSLSSFRRDFLSVYNMPPSQWIRERRLKKACELLLNTSMTVTDICYTLGFENIAHFSRLFKSQNGIPPSEYRIQAISV